MVGAINLDIEIRSAAEQDYHSVFKLLREFAEYDDLDPANIKLNESAYLKYGFGPEECFYCDLGIINKNPIAYSMYSIRFSGVSGGPVVYLEDIFVSENFRNRGIGKLLMDHTINFAKRNNCTCIEWVVNSGNTSAQRFYESLGAQLNKGIIVSRLDIQDS